MNGTSLHKLKLSKTKLAFLLLVLTWIFLDTQRFGNFPIMIILITLFLFNGRIVKKIGFMEKNLLAFCSYGIFITAINFSSNAHARNSIMLLIEYLIIIFGMHVLCNNVDITSFFHKIGIFGGLICIYGCIEGLLNFPLLHYILSGRQNIPDIGLPSYRVTLMFAYPIVCGGFLMVFLILNLLYPPKEKWKRYLFLVVIFANILLNKSRSNWIAVAFVVLLLLYFRGYLKLRELKKIKKNRIFVLIALVALLAVLKCFGYDVIGMIVDMIESRVTGSLNAGEGQIVRIETTLSSIEYWKNGHWDKFIFGGGKNFDKVFLKMYPVIKGGGSFVWDGAIDNQYITTIHEFGIIGLFFIVTILLAAIYRLFKCSKNDKIAIAANTLLCGWSIIIYFYEAFNFPLVFMMYVFLALISDVAYRESKYKKNKGRNNLITNSVN